MTRQTSQKTLTPTQTQLQAVLQEMLFTLMAGSDAPRLHSYEEVCLARSMTVLENQR